MVTTSFSDPYAVLIHEKQALSNQYKHSKQ